MADQEPAHAPGDLVVTLRMCDRSDHDLLGLVCTVACLSRLGGRVAYGLRSSASLCIEWASAVRRPTEAELATWALEGGHG